MISYPDSLQRLIESLKSLPGIGNRSAQRMAIWLLQQDKQTSREMESALQAARENISTCPLCGFYLESAEQTASEAHCKICDDSNRDSSVICVVEQASDVIALEGSGAYRGLYHCLGGRLSPLDNIGPEDLHIESLLQRAAESSTQEVILAMHSDVEGDATANYLSDELKKLSIRSSRPAQGLPAGGQLEHADSLTLSRAIEGRREIF